MTQVPHKYISTHYTNTYFNKRDVLDVPIAEAIKKFMHERQLDRVLDVGCGSGRMVKFLSAAGFESYGCDVNKIAVRMARKLNGYKRIKLATATRLPYREHQFDIVISVSVIEHITKSQVAQFLKETKRILKPEGFIFIVTPNFATPLRTIQKENWGGYQDPTHINFYTPASLANTLKSSQFSDITTTMDIPYKNHIGIGYFAHIHYLPVFLKPLIGYLFFSTGLRHFRNSFWMAACKP